MINSSMKRGSPTPKTEEAARILDQMTGNDQELQQTIADEMMNAEMAHLIY